jgi:riboflavin synthase
MFTGIIEGLGTISSIRPSGRGKHLTVTADFRLDGMKIGDSIAVNGACLTAVSIAGTRFEADVSFETLKTTTMGDAKVGRRMNLERAMRLSDRLDGHLVSGHVDGTGTIKERSTVDNAVAITIAVPASLGRYMIRKGSVAVDGISLTINQCRSDMFEVAVIPHTAKLTTLGFKKVGETVNIETDMIGKYVERFTVGPHDDSEKKEGDRPSGIDIEFLGKSGFL